MWPILQNRMTTPNLPRRESDDDTQAYLDDVQRLRLNAWNDIAADVEASANWTGWKDLHSAPVVDREFASNIRRTISGNEDHAGADSVIRFHNWKGSLDERVRVVDDSFRVAIQEVRRKGNRVFAP